MVDLSNIITDPSVSFIEPTQYQFSDNPFTAGAEFAAQGQRRRQEQRFLDTLATNNALRAIMAQRLAAQAAQEQRFTDLAGNLDKFVGAFGPNAVASQVGFEPSGFTNTIQQQLLAGGAADIAKTTGEATDAFREGGQAAQFVPGLLSAGGIAGLTSVTPTSVEAAAAAAGPELSGFVRGIHVKGKDRVLGQDLLEQLIARSSRPAPTGTEGQFAQMTEIQGNTVKELINTLELQEPGAKAQYVIRPDRNVAVVLVGPDGRQFGTTIVVDENGHTREE